MHFEASRGRIFMPPPSFIRPPTPIGVPQKGTADRGHADFVRFSPILSDLRRFCPIFAGVLQTLENKAPILFNFAPILSDLAFFRGSCRGATRGAQWFRVYTSRMESTEWPHLRASPVLDTTGKFHEGKEGREMQRQKERK